MNHVVTGHVSEWLTDQEHIRNDEPSDRDSFVVINGANDTDSDDTMTEQSMDGHDVGMSEDLEDAILVGEFVEINEAMIDNLLSSRSRINVTSSEGSSADDEESLMTEVDSEEPLCETVGLTSSHVPDARVDGRRTSPSREGSIPSNRNGYLLRNSPRPNQVNATTTGSFLHGYGPLLHA